MVRRQDLIYGITRTRYRHGGRARGIGDYMIISMWRMVGMSTVPKGHRVTCYFLVVNLCTS